MAEVNDSNGKLVFYGVGNGALSRDPKPGDAEDRLYTTSKGNPKCKVGAVVGRLTDVRTKDGKFGKEINVTLTDEDGVGQVIGFGAKASHTRTFFRRVGGVLLDKDVMLSAFSGTPYQSEEYGEVTPTHISLKQQDPTGSWESVADQYTKEQKPDIWELIDDQRPTVDMINLAGKTSEESPAKEVYEDAVTENGPQDEPDDLPF